MDKLLTENGWWMFLIGAVGLPVTWYACWWWDRRKPKNRG